ncbi:MAG: putative metal-binding motif-containing protein [Planctomycetes bacterium]|nr:putative metal-binding motif-containing protein [Planctomycetota bacterium]
MAFTYLAAALLLSSAGSGDETTTIQAWRQHSGWVLDGWTIRWVQGYDLDEDGYAAAGAPTSALVSLVVPAATKLAPPAGYVTKSGDLDDHDPDVHPRRPEILGNGIDDDCDGAVDETEFHRLASGDRTTTGFTMRVRINDREILDVYTATGFVIERLTYRIEYQNLNASSGAVLQTGRRDVSGMTVYPSQAELLATLDGLTPRNVYRARVVFFATRRFTTGFETHRQVGDPSEWYYQCTDATNEMAADRAWIVSRALYSEFAAEQLGLLGYHGTAYPDGTAFGADVGEPWCTEFYSGCADERFSMGHRHYIGDFDPPPVPLNSGAITHYFLGFGELTTVDAGNRASVLASLLPGDYVALDTTGDGNANHSAMVLAYEPTDDRVWTVEGNTGGSQCGIQQRDPAQIMAWGRLQASMRD